MKALIIKATLLLGAAVTVYHYIDSRNTAINPLDKLRALKAPSWALSSPSLPSPQQTVYKWVDANGVTQYSETPPEHVHAQTLNISPDTNIVESLKIPSNPKKPLEKEAQLDTSAPAPPQPNIYNPDTIKQVMDKAKDTQKRINERINKQTDVLDKI